MPDLRVIHGTPEPDTPAQRVTNRVKAMPKPAATLQCRRCGGRELVPTVTGAQFKNGKISGGVKTLYCFNCMLKGERAEVL